MRRVPMAGGTPSTVIEMPVSIIGAAWGPDDRIVFGQPTGLYSVAATGGIAERLTTDEPEEGVIDYRWPRFLPDGNTLLYVRWRGSIGTSEVTARSMVTGEERVLVQGSAVHYATSGHLLYAAETELWAVPFDPGRLELTGAPARVVDELLTFRRGGAANYATAADGALVYVSSSVNVSEGNQTLSLVSRDGQAGDVIHAGLLQSPRHLQQSPDGRRVGVVTGPLEQGALWIFDLDGRPPMPLSDPDGNGAFPVWSRDGARVTFQTRYESSPGALVSVAADGSMPEPELLLAGPDSLIPYSWTPGDEGLLFDREASDGRATTLWRLPPDGEPQLVLNEGANRLFAAQLSADGRWIAYESVTTGASEVWIRPYPDGAPVRVSNGGGSQPRWSADGRELFYLEAAEFGGGRMMVVAVETEPVFRFDPPVMLFDGSYNHSAPFSYLPQSDGRFIMIRNLDNAIVETPSGPPTAPGDHMVVVLNLHDELNRVAPPER